MEVQRRLYVLLPDSVRSYRRLEEIQNNRSFDAGETRNHVCKSWWRAWRLQRRTRTELQSTRASRRSPSRLKRGCRTTIVGESLLATTRTFSAYLRQWRLPKHSTVATPASLVAVRGQGSRQKPGDSSSCLSHAARDGRRYFACAPTEEAAERGRWAQAAEGVRAVSTCQGKRLLCASRPELIPTSPLAQVRRRGPRRAVREVCESQRGVQVQDPAPRTSLELWQE